MAEKDYEQFSKSDNKQVLEKLNVLLEQNKTIAKGLSMLHEEELPEETQKPIQHQQPPRHLLPSERLKLQRRPQQSYY